MATLLKELTGNAPSLRRPTGANTDDVGAVPSGSEVATLLKGLTGSPRSSTPGGDAVPMEVALCVARSATREGMCKRVCPSAAWLLGRVQCDSKCLADSGRSDVATRLEELAVAICIHIHFFFSLKNRNAMVC